MGNTPSAPQGSPARAQTTQNNADRAHTTNQTPPSTSSTPSTSSRNPNLRLPMPQRPVHVSPQSSRPTSPSGPRSGSPRRRKSLELPDLNKLSFTPAAPIPTTATQTENFFAPTTPAVGHFKSYTIAASPPPATAPMGTISPSKWKQAMGGPSPLVGPTALGAVSTSEEKNVPASETAPGAMRHTSISPTRAQEPASNPYFPAHPPLVTRPKPREASPRGVEAAPIPIKSDAPILGLNINESKSPSVVAASLSTGTSPLPSNASEDEPNDGLVNVPVQWTGSGKVVYVTGNFADNWKGRIQLKRSTHDFNTVLRLPPGQYRLKFIVDDSWRCSKQIPTATDDDGTLVNWMEVETSKTEEELKVEWAMGASPVAKQESADDALWTNHIPVPLTLYQYLEELPHTFSQEQLHAYYQTAPYLSSVPQPPSLPRILDKVIVNAEPRKTWDDHQQVGWANATPAGLDDNSILAVPNHVVLNHLTASAIKNGTLGVGTTTRYRKKYITTMFFKPTLGDLVGDAGTATGPLPR